MIINAYCARCLEDKWLAKCPDFADAETAAEYRRRVREIVSEKNAMSSPEKDYAVRVLWEAMFPGSAEDFGPVKRHFNAMLMALEPEMFRAAMASDDPLRRAVQYAMTGNFIDFAALDSVDEGTLQRMLDKADRIPVDAGLLTQLRDSVERARRLTYLLDNCGEIVMDRVLMRVIREINPGIEITAVVKGAPVVNDATREDAEQARLWEVAAVEDTGVGIAGVPEDRVSEACRQLMAQADVMISKGQANYETLCGCGLDIYYIFMCKCQLFMDRFHVPQFSGIITREKGA